LPDPESYVNPDFKFYLKYFLCLRPGRVKRKNAKKGTEKADEEEED
jgi:hypothetical protein